MIAAARLEHTPDGVQLAYGPRVPLLMFGGPVTTTIDSRWNAHPSIGKTLLDLLGLPPLGLPPLGVPASTPRRLADLVDTTAKPSATPPAYGALRRPTAPRSPSRLCPHRRPPRIPSHRHPHRTPPLSAR